ncbi:c-type cytochrome [Pseudenhygromyxa sp. WMMC2535]|uniref:c-type cytochrome n=1 Tax=Pseudenhygromyxa sp. WMMC2535 TaxID=2712867 RepID=UPI001553C8BF|nr:c-type cytochrome [Pseudenhygromyxa sp. WMMC2535]NVB39377.1 c-type cytochrome [Pseudenhygromyxa sp. WMMC2535]
MTAKPGMTWSLLSAAVLGLGLAAADDAAGRKLMMEDTHEFGPQVAATPDFAFEGAPLGDVSAPTVLPHVGSHGGTVIADGEGALSIDRDSGALVRSDASGRAVASLAFSPGAGELVRDGASGAVFLADRADDRVVMIAPGDAGGRGLEVLSGAQIREPHGLALSPDGATLYVTSVANHELVALDTQTMAQRWAVELAPEPRGVAVSADGKRAVVGFLSMGALASVELDGLSPSVSYIALDPGRTIARGNTVADAFSGPQQFNTNNSLSNQRFNQGKPSLADVQDIGRGFARNTYVVGFVGDGLIVAPHQLSAPHMANAGREDEGTYGGGGFLPSIIHRLAMVDSEHSVAPAVVFATIGVHQPRALAYDAASDTLYLAGYGDDRIMAVAEVSRSTAHMAWSTWANPGHSCGVDGLAVDAEGLWVHCELGRNLVRHDLASMGERGVAKTTVGPALTASARSQAAQRGAELFRRGGETRLSGGGVMACASCHAEGRSDGLSWRIEGHNLQTPMLGGRLQGAHPFKWDGKDADLRTSLTNTVGRLGGSGLSHEEVSDLEAFLSSLPPPKAPSVTDSGAVVRGRAVFESADAACSACHDGPRLADGNQYDLDTNIGAVDTPSLIGLAHSAPYYHDGSARTLRALLTDKGSVHDMGSTAHLSVGQVDDLIAYLESL